jgi:hypothetical protein
MTESVQKLAIGRIVIALASEEVSDPVLEAAARLAASTQSELAGLFVEDINLVRLAALPFAREFSHFTCRERPLESADVERRLKAQATAAERALARIAERIGVPWSFRIARGMVAALLREVAPQVDAIALCTGRHGMARQMAAIAGAGGRLRARTGGGFGVNPVQPIVVVFTGSAGSRRAFRVAARQTADRHPLMVFIVADTPEKAGRLKQEARGLVGDQPLHFRRLTRWEIGALLKTAHAERPWLLVLEADENIFEPGTVQALYEQLSCPVLLVR